MIAASNGWWVRVTEDGHFARVIAWYDPIELRAAYIGKDGNTWSAHFPAVRVFHTDAIPRDIHHEYEAFRAALDKKPWDEPEQVAKVAT